uniref:Uncharacterized protein n=1 Tax=Arundo donax TaxID=35708 RepID=A0A0A9EYN2_ARUDO
MSITESSPFIRKIKHLDGCWDKRSEDPLVSRFSTPSSFCSGMKRIETGRLFGLMIESSRTVESCKTGLLAGDNSPVIITWKICTSNGL